MDGQEKLLDYETIKAAVAGEKWATEKVLAHYADYIDELSTVEIRQPGGKVKKVIDEDMCSSTRTESRNSNLRCHLACSARLPTMENCRSLSTESQHSPAL